MTFETILAFVVGGLALYCLYVITKKLVVALFFGAFISGVLFLVVPALTHRDDAVGEAARLVDSVVKGVIESARDVVGHPDTKALVKKAKREVESITADTVDVIGTTPSTKRTKLPPSESDGEQ